MSAALPARAHHIVRFSTHDDDLIPALADFVSDGVRLGERVVLLITDAHWAALELELIARHVRIGAALKHHEVIVLSAETTLARIVDGTSVDMARFNALFAPILESLQPPVRAFGEMSGMLAAGGHLSAAIEMEQLGVSLSREAGMNVLCAYHHDQLDAPEKIDTISALHDAVVTDGTRTRPVVLLAGQFTDGDAHAELLRSRGCQVVIAHDGLQAISLARMARPAVMILENRMPRMSGLEAMQFLKKEPAFRRVPIVAVLPHGLQSERQTYLASGFDEVLAEPCAPADVANAAARLLSS